MQNRCGSLNRFVDQNWPSFDFSGARLNRPLLQIPRLGQRTRSLRACYAASFMRDAKIVAEARTHGAGDIRRDDSFFLRDGKSLST
jgi:hypothetical protein